MYYEKQIVGKVVWNFKQKKQQNENFNGTLFAHR